MASKSTSQKISTANVTEEGAKSKSPPPPPPQRPARMKSIPKRLHHGVDRSIKGVSQSIPEASSQNPKKRGVSFEQPIPLPPRKKRSTAEEKGKKKVAGMSKTKPARTKRASTSVHSSSQAQSSSEATSSTDTQPKEAPPVLRNAIEEIRLHKSAPEGFTIATVPLTPEQSAKFKDSYTNRGFCAVVAVDLDSLHRECNVNLSPWLAPYNTFTSISAAFYPNLVKLFYFNMQSDNILNSDGELVEERVTTCVKGVKFTLSASIINSILKITNPPPVSTPTYSNQEIFTTLVPNTEFPENQRHSLSFKPGSMSPINRVLWYIYSRNFVQKGGSFTHFSQRDYRFFTAFVKQHPLNVGHWIFQEMIRFKFSSRRPSHIPFPSLVSLILFYHKIWYVGPPESMKYPPSFGKAQLNFMKLNFEAEGSGQSRAPSRSQARASQSEAHEAQSTPPHPSDLDSRIKGIVDAAIASLSIRLEFEIGKLVAEVRSGNHEMVDAQEAMRLQINELKEETQKKQDEHFDQLIDLDARLSTHSIATSYLDNKVDKILQHLGIGSSSSTLGTTSKPQPESATPSFSFPSPPIPSSSPASTSTPATVVLPSPSFPTTVPPQFEDDKGGEEEKDT